MAKHIFDTKRFTLLDGAMGTMLQRMGLEAGGRPEQMAFTAKETLCHIHRAYVEAGADILYANTFGANRIKLHGSPFTVNDCVIQAVRCAKEACNGTQTRVALDIGPLGELLEPVGHLCFEEAYELFREMVVAGVSAGADLIVIETMTDLYEAKAALLAAKENSNLPVMVSMSFEENGRTFSGTPIEAMAVCLGSLGADALGINCSLGPNSLRPLAKRLCKASPVPVFVKPNAGLPNPHTGEYTVSSEGFSSESEAFLSLGVVALGGCCGTGPEHIQALKALVQGKMPATTGYTPQSLLCSGTRVVSIDGVCPVGERINPTGKKELQQALLQGDLSHVQQLAVQQEQAGATMLDVNVGAAGANEVMLLPQAVKAVQAVCDLPLVLDSANEAALAAALRVYNGRPLVNSTSGEAKKMEVILPLCKRYGAAVIGLAIDEGGIAESADARVLVAKNILQKALQYGFNKEDIYIDCLTLAASAGLSSSMETINALQRVKNELQLKTVLGVSNVSFGMPNRPLLNRSFLLMALQAGLDLPILNPVDCDMMDTVASFRLLSGCDCDAKQYLARFETRKKDENSQQKQKVCCLQEAIENGLRQEAADAVKVALQCGEEGMSLVEKHIVPALDVLGNKFESGEIFLPQLIAGAEAAKAAFEVVRNKVGQAVVAGPPVVVATVQGDVHDIGKNIAVALLENYGFDVIDLGRDVPAEAVVEAVKQSGAKLAGLSALMTTTLPSMEHTIQCLHKEQLSCKVMVGGAVLSETYAMQIGADYYVEDAQKSVLVAQTVYGK